jgi:hypothetical protein
MHARGGESLTRDIAETTHVYRIAAGVSVRAMQREKQNRRYWTVSTESGALPAQYGRFS